VIRKVRFAAAAGALVIAVLLIYCLLFGKLFPYSPVIIGFVEHELENTIVYIQKGTDYAGLEEIDQLTPHVEAFHELKFLHKPRIFIFKDNKDYHQRSLSQARFCAFYNGDLVISPWALKEAEKGEISLEIYLKHELSHSLIFQHTGLIRAFRYPHWLLEGIAMYSSNQMGTSWYPSKAETWSCIRNGNFLSPKYYKTRKEDQIRLDVGRRITFIYSEFACIVDYLVEHYGRDKLISYMKGLISDGGHDKVFEEIYGIEFDTCMQEFKEFVTQE